MQGAAWPKNALPCHSPKTQMERRWRQGFQRSLQVAESPTSSGVAAQEVDVKMGYYRSSVYLTRQTQPWPQGARPWTPSSVRVRPLLTGVKTRGLRQVIFFSKLGASAMAFFFFKFNLNNN